MPNPNDIDALDKIIRARATQKVLADAPLDCEIDDAVINAIVAAAGHAPFHYPAAGVHRQTAQASCAPWRFYIVAKPACLQIREQLLAADDASKIPNLLAACDCLIQATWCPEPPGDFPTDAAHAFRPSATNMEHIAATAAAVQNLLLAATAHGVGGYWSSGGALRSSEIFAQLGIANEQVLLGSVFLFSDTRAQPAAKVTRIPGKMRGKQGAMESWSRWVRALQ